MMMKHQFWKNSIVLKNAPRCILFQQRGGKCINQTQGKEILFSATFNARGNFFCSESLGVAFTIYVRKAKVAINSEELLYEFSNWLAEVGGFLGLCLGYSVLSLVFVVSGLVEKLVLTVQKSHESQMF